jgi:3',5'-cyclic AMP phosphodiesterase CpdA
VQAERISNQLAHIERMLNDSIEAKPTWLLVAGHYPVVSRGQHGDISELKTYLLPLLEKYHVHAYFCGHDHLSEVCFILILGSLIKLLKSLN